MAKKKRKAKVVNLQPSLSPSKYIKKFGRKLEIHETLCPINLFEIGKGNIYVARKKRNGDFIVGIYLVDTYCLGVKDTFYQLIPNWEYEEFREHIMEMTPFPLETIEANYAFNIIYGAVEYAEDLGIEPHKDFSNTEYLLPPPEDLEYIDLEFGDNGKPCYYYYDGDKKADILNKLTKAVGPDGFTFVDGQPFLDDIDGEFYDEYEEDIFAVAEERFETEAEKTAYILFGSIVQYWDRDFGDYFEDLESLFHHNKHKVCRLIKEEIADLIDFDKEMNVDEYLLSITEKYLIYRDAEFIYDEMFLVAFDISDKELEVPSMVGSINLSKSGKEKVQMLLNALHSITKDERKDTGLVEYLKEVDNILENGTSSLPDYSVFLIVNYLKDHEEYYGPINFDEYDLTGGG